MRFVLRGQVIVSCCVSVMIIALHLCVVVQHELRLFLKSASNYVFSIASGDSATRQQLAFHLKLSITPVKR